GFILYIHQIIHLYTKPEFTCKSEWMHRLFFPHTFMPQQERKAHVHSVVHFVPIRVSIYFIIPFQAIWHTCRKSKEDMGSDIFITGDIILEEHGKVKEVVGRARNRFHIDAFLRTYFSF